MDENDIEQFKEIVIQYVNLDDLLRSKNEEIKEIKKDKKEIEEYIIECMEKLNEGVIDISDGKLRLNKTKTKTGLKESYLEESLQKLTNDNQKAQLMTKQILENRPVKERVNIKRTFNRKKTKTKTNNK